MQKSSVPGTGPVTASLAIPDMTSTIGALDPTITWSTSGLNVTVITPYNVVHTYSAAAGTIEAITVSGTLAAPANPSTGKFAISHVASGNYFVAGRYDDCGGTASGFIQILVATPNVIMPWIKIQNAAAPAVTIQGNELLNSGSTASGSGTLNQTSGTLNVNVLTLNGTAPQMDASGNVKAVSSQGYEFLNSGSVTVGSGSVNLNVGNIGANILMLNSALTDGTPAANSRPVLHLKQLDLDAGTSGVAALRMSSNASNGVWQITGSATGISVVAGLPLSLQTTFSGVPVIALTGLNSQWLSISDGGTPQLVTFNVLGTANQALATDAHLSDGTVKISGTAGAYNKVPVTMSAGDFTGVLTVQGGTNIFLADTGSRGVMLSGTAANFTGAVPASGNWATATALAALALKFSGITYVANWLRALARTDADTTTLAELSGSLGTYTSTVSQFSTASSLTTIAAVGTEQTATLLNRIDDGGLDDHTATSTQVHAWDITALQVGDVIWPAGSQEAMLLTNTNTSSGIMTLQRGYMNTVPTPLYDEEMLRVVRAWPTPAAIDTQLSGTHGAGAWGGAGGTGANSVTITVTDTNSSPLANVKTRLYAGAVNLLQSTGTTGAATFGVDNGTYALILTLPGYQFTPTTITVSSASSFTEQMTPTYIPQPTSPTGCVVYFNLIDDDGTPVVGEQVTFTQTTAATGSGNVYLGGTTIKAPSGTGGLVTAELPQTAVWQASFGSTAAGFSIPVPAQATYQLPNQQL